MAQYCRFYQLPTITVHGASLFNQSLNCDNDKLQKCTYNFDQSTLV